MGGLKKITILLAEDAVSVVFSLSFFLFFRDWGEKGGGRRGQGIEVSTLYICTFDTDCGLLGGARRHAGCT